MEFRMTCIRKTAMMICMICFVYVYIPNDNYNKDKQDIPEWSQIILD